MTAPTAPVSPILPTTPASTVTSWRYSRSRPARGARSVNALMTASYWEIGRRIVELEQGGKARAEYGKALLLQLAQDLSARFWPGVQQAQFAANASVLPGLACGTDLADGVCQIHTDRIFRITGSENPWICTICPIWPKPSPCPGQPMCACFSVKNQHARSFYETEALRCGWKRCGNWNGRSTASSTNASPCRATRLPCWKRPRWPSPATP